MLIVHRSYPDSFADEVEERLKNLVVAYAVEEDTTDGARLTQSGRTYSEREEVRVFLDELEEEVLEGRQFQSDACYLDPDAPEQCL